MILDRMFFHKSWRESYLRELREAKVVSWNDLGRTYRGVVDRAVYNSIANTDQQELTSSAIELRRHCCVLEWYVSMFLHGRIAYDFRDRMSRNRGKVVHICVEKREETNCKYRCPK